MLTRMNREWKGHEVPRSALSDDPSARAHVTAVGLRAPTRSQRGVTPDSRFHVAHDPSAADSIMKGVSRMGHRAPRHGFIGEDTGARPPLHRLRKRKAQSTRGRSFVAAHTRFT